MLPAEERVQLREKAVALSVLSPCSAVLGFLVILVDVLEFLLALLPAAAVALLGQLSAWPKP